MPVTRNYPDSFTEAELREMMDYYRSQTDEPGDVLVAIDLPKTPDGFLEICEDCGVAWVLTTGYDGDGFDLSLDEIRAGPPT